MEGDPTIMWRLLYDIWDYKLTEEEKARGEVRLGRRRRRIGDREEILAVALPKTFTNDPFPKALEKLVVGSSQREFAAKMRCSQTTVSRLISGTVEPDKHLMERAAEAAEVAPWYFVEYRVAYLTDAIRKALVENPNMSMTYLQKLGVVT